MPNRQFEENRLNAEQGDVFDEEAGHLLQLDGDGWMDVLQPLVQ